MVEAFVVGGKVTMTRAGGKDVRDEGPGQGELCWASL
ncbi:hypothetical protein K3495_g13521 [Podosphaera aphanis]|nr:hypothetical protein K3495_g13521 [Podosphaera aphanis]